MGASIFLEIAALRIDFLFFTRDKCEILIIAKIFFWYSKTIQQLQNLQQTDIIFCMHLCQNVVNSWLHSSVSKSCHVLIKIVEEGVTIHIDTL